MHVHNAALCKRLEAASPTKGGGRGPSGMHGGLGIDSGTRGFPIPALLLEAANSMDDRDEAEEQTHDQCVSFGKGVVDTVPWVPGAEAFCQQLVVLVACCWCHG